MRRVKTKISADSRRRRKAAHKLHCSVVEESLDAIGEALAENGKVVVTGCLGAKDGGEFVRRAHPRVLAVTGPHAEAEVMAAVHAQLPKPHDPFSDLVPPQGIKLTPTHYAYLKIAEGCNHRCSFSNMPRAAGEDARSARSSSISSARSASSACGCGCTTSILIRTSTKFCR